MESYNFSFAEDVRLQVSLNILMAVIYSFWQFRSILHAMNAFFGTLLCALLVSQVFPRHRVTRKSLENPFSRRRSHNRGHFFHGTRRQWVLLSVWLLCYTAWNLRFASELSGWPVALTHNFVPLFIVTCTGYHRIRTSPSSLFYIWAFLRAVCICIVEILYLSKIFSGCSVGSHFS